MKIAVIGSINMDQVVTTKRIPTKGETVSGSDLAFIPGGKGANQAVAMARLGADVTMFGCVGKDDNGRILIENLKKNGVHTEDIRILEHVPTGLAMITVAENDNMIVVVSGANAHVDTDYIEQIKPRLKDFDLVVLQHEIPLSAVHAAISYCHAQSIKVVLNPAPAAEVPMEIVSQVTYLTPNEHEAALIFETHTSPEELVSQYPEKLIITCGKNGVLCCTKKGRVLRIPSIPAKVVDTTGAGDTLNGAFCVRIAAGDSIEQALIYANTAAGLSIEKFGAQGGMPTHDQVQAYLSSIS